MASNKTIVLWWEGPYSNKDKNKINNDLKKEKISKYGIYQIYGNHPVFGMNSLLYIGKADEQDIIKRAVEQHGFAKEWEDDFEPIFFYFGGLGGPKGSKPANTSWQKLIDIAERILICAHKPPFNQKHIEEPGEKASGYTVFNYNHRANLLMEISYKRITEDLTEWEYWCE